MAKSLSQQTVRAFALIGARARMESLQAEIDALVSSFPELGRGGRGGRARATKAGAGPVKKARRRRRRKAMTAEQKQAVSERMRKYWASPPEGQGVEAVGFRPGPPGESGSLRP